MNSCIIIIDARKMEGYFESLFAFVSGSGWADVRYPCPAPWPPQRCNGVVATLPGTLASTDLSAHHQSRGQGGGKFPIS